MLPWLILGISLLVAFLLAARWFVSADPTTLVKSVKWIAVGLGVLVVLFLAVTGRLLAALPGLLVLFLLARRRRGFGNPFGRRAPSAGQKSDIETEYILMTLEHDSGEMRGRVLRGRFAGKDFAELGLDELLELLAECNRHDEQAARLVETYLDRTQSGDWRARAGAGRGAGSARMGKEEAYEILGLEPGASKDEIKDAHHRLMQKIHPDHGGSTYLASKINAAKDALLDA